MSEETVVTRYVLGALVAPKRRNRGRCLAALLAVVTCSLVATTPLVRAEEGPSDSTDDGSDRPAYIGHWAYGRLDGANAALLGGHYEAALKFLDEIRAVVEKDRASRRREKVNAHERALMWQTYGYVYAAQERYADGLEAFENAIAEQGLPLPAELGVRSNLAQLYLGEGEYDKAIENFEIWFARTSDPTPEAHYMLAMAYALSGDKDSAVPHAEAAVEKSDAPQEGRLQLLSSLYFEKGRYTDVEVLLRQLLTHFPSKKYWMQLAAIYAEMGQYDLALAVQEAMFEQHLLSEHREYITLAQLHLNGGLPYEAARVLEAGLDAGIVEDTEEGWSLLATALLQAQEYALALAPLERAAAKSARGDGYVRLGEVYLGEEHWSEARKAFAAALAKGGLDDVGTVHVLMGIANASDQRFDEAKQAFVSAQKYPATAEMASQWIAHVDQQRELLKDEAEYARSRSEAHRENGENARYASVDDLH
jgi:tetratricopeptide (TPR) repeat protein